MENCETPYILFPGYSYLGYSQGSGTLAFKELHEVRLVDPDPALGTKAGKPFAPKPAANGGFRYPGNARGLAHRQQFDGHGDNLVGLGARQGLGR